MHCRRPHGLTPPHAHDSQARRDARPILQAHNAPPTSFFTALPRCCAAWSAAGGDFFYRPPSNLQPLGQLGADPTTEQAHGWGPHCGALVEHGTTHPRNKVQTAFKSSNFQAVRHEIRVLERTPNLVARRGTATAQPSWPRHAGTPDPTQGCIRPCRWLRPPCILVALTVPGRPA